jgi:hypothetical protein
MEEKLLKIQMEIGAIKKDSVNPHFKNKYFDINTLLAEVKPILNKHGVILLQGLTSIEGKLALETKLMGIDSEEIEAYTCPIPEGADAQKTGSAITYFRRYALQSLLALEAEDDDANLASKSVQKPVANVTKNAKPVKGEINNEDLPW